ncbi:Ig-like domain-containing protein [Candidatus Gracilibacteria bacterium]|nr:Ig-like domain-containing protein [Candidatus Gracilibacteria bacterium]
MKITFQYKFIERLFFSLGGCFFLATILLFSPTTYAANGVNVMPVNMGGMDVYLSDTTATALLQIDLFDEGGGTLNTIQVNLDKDTGWQMFVPTSDLALLSGDANAGISLWKDNGDGSFGAGDILVGTQPTDWPSSQIQDCMETWLLIFSNIGVPISTSATSMTTLFVVGKAAVVDQTPIHSFGPRIPMGGIQTSGGSIGNFPSNCDMPFSPVWLGPVGSGGGGMMGSPLAISEIQTAGGIATDEFIELYSRDMEDFLMSEEPRFTIVYEAWNSGNSEEELQIKANWDASFEIITGTIPINGFYLLKNAGYDGGTVADATYSFSLSESGGFVGLFEGEQLVDMVGYGNATANLAEGGQVAPAPSANGSIERKAFPDSTASKMTGTGIHSSMGNGEDSQNNGMDFIIRTTSDPQNTASQPESMGGMGMGSLILLNEVFYNTDTGLGWIEIFNQSVGPVNLSEGTGWNISSNGKTYSFPASATLSAGAYGIVYWNKTGDDILTSTFYTDATVDTDMATFGGEVVLKDGAGNIVDYVQYGGTGFTNESAANSAGEWMIGDKVQSTLYGQSMGRRMNDPDYNFSGDWQVYSSPSPFIPNMGGDSTVPTAVSEVTLIDNDTVANSGLNGNDLTITWTPASTIDPTFDKYDIYILPEGIALDDTSHSPIDSIFGGQYQYNSEGTRLSTISYAGAPFITHDSADNLLDTGSYVTYIVGVDFAGNSSGSAMSSPSSLTAEIYDAGSDDQGPFIMHMGVWNAKADVAMNLIVRAVDDREIDATNPLQVVYDVNASGSWTVADCSFLDADFYNCQIPSQTAGAQVSYYLKAKDAATTPNYSYFSASPTSDMSGIEDNVKTTPFVIEMLTSVGNYDDDGTAVDLSGTIYKPDGTAFPDDQWPKVFIEGTATGVITPNNATGIFNFPDNTLLAGSQNMVIFKEGYMDMMINVFKGDSVDTYMNEGTMNMTGGGDKPFVTWTAPGPGMMGTPTDIFCTGDCTSFGMGEMPIIIGFDKTMNANTINDQDASNAGSNIYLTTNGQDRIAGKVRYDASMNEAIFYATTHNSLSPGTFYNIVVTQGVTDMEGNPIFGDGVGGAFVTGFSTMMDNTDMWGSGGDDFTTFGGGGMMMPPYVVGTIPASGSFDIPLNSSVTVEFSEPMDSSSINSTNIKLYPITNEANWTIGTSIPATVTLDQATQRIATITPIDPLVANVSNNGRYIVRVMGAVKSSMGIWMMNPSICGETNPDICLATQMTYESDFQVSGISDNIDPTIQGTYPKNNDTNVNVGLPFIDIGFSEGMSSGTITAQNITLTSGSTAVSGNVKYDAMNKMAKFIPNNALSANTQYTLTIGTNVEDLAGRTLASAYLANFTTGASDTVSPEVMYANGDDYSLAVSFSEPMNVALQTDTNRWDSSVLNPANYYINGLDSEGSWADNLGLVDPYNNGGGNQLSGISGLNFTYDEGTMTVIIEGFAFSVDTPAFQIFIDNVKDKSGNILTDTGNRSASGTHKNAARGPLLNSTETFGLLGPGGGPGIMGGGEMGPIMDMDSMGMMMAGAFPMNAMAGQTSMYFVDIPTTKSIPTGGKIRLTFPAGFDVSGAEKDIFSPVNSDINEWNAGTITITSVTGIQASRTIDIITGGEATQVNDFLHMDIQGIVNSSIPKDFQTSGYTIDIKTFTADGALLETISTMPLFINEGGLRTISGTITAAGATTGTMEVYLGSPMTGPMERTVDFAALGNGTAAYSFTNLPDGDYHIFTEPFVTLNSINYVGRQMPEPIWVSGGDSIGNDFTLLAENVGANATITVTLTGDFSSGGIDDNIDIFASSPKGFRVKTVNPNGDDSAGGDTSLDTVQGNYVTKYNLFLPEGDWHIGIGPAMPKGAMMGPPKMPDWMPPMPVKYKSIGSGTGEVSVSISGQEVSRTITGIVQNDSGVGIADAEVYAYQPTGGFGGSNARTAADGTFVLKIPVLGTYVVGAFKSGLPNGQEQTVNVQNDVTGIVFKIKKPGQTISGKVLNAQSQPIAYAPVWAYQTTGWGHSNTMTDATGNYILYVDDGTWSVETDAPGVGWMQYERVITINNASASNINLKPASDTTWRTISGTVGIDTDGAYSTVETPFANMPIRATKYDATGNYLGYEYGGMTDSSGNYSLNVISGIYRVDIWNPDYGEQGINNQNNNNILNEPADDSYTNNPANVNASSGDVNNADIIIVNSGLRTITLQFTNGQADQEGFVSVEGVTFDGNNVPTPTGFHRSFHVGDLSASTTMRLGSGDYLFFLQVPTLGELIPIADDGTLGMDPIKKDIVVGGIDRTVQFTLPDVTNSDDVIIINGTISGPTANQSNAWVWIGNPQTGFHAGVESNTVTGAYSIKVPKLLSGNYFVGSDKPSFAAGEPVSITGTVDTIVDFTLTTLDKTISGVLYADANSNGSYDSGEEVPNGRVFAETSNGLKSYGPVDGTGAYSINVTSGTWKVFGFGDGYIQTKYPDELVVAGLSLTGKNISLSSDANWNNVQTAKPITPAQGGKISDTGQATDGTASGTGMELTFPPNALGSSSSSGNVTTKRTNSVTGTSSMDPLTGKAIEITAKDNSGQPITNLSNYVDLEMVIYKKEIENDGMQNFNKLKSMKIGYWDETTNSWIYLETTRKAYYKDTADTQWTMYNGDGIVSGYVKFITDALVGTTPTFVEGVDYDDYKFVLKAKTNHFTVFAPGTAPDGVVPSAPTGLIQSSGNGTNVGLSWNAVTTNVDASVITDLYGYAVYRSIDGTTYSQVNTSNIPAGTETYTDSTTTAWTSYYYKITAGDDDNLESAYSTNIQSCSNKSVSNGTVAGNCTITCNSGYVLSGKSCLSSGGGSVGGGGGGGVSMYRTYNTIPSYTLSNKESIRKLDLVEPINLIFSGGVFTRPVQLKNLYTGTVVEFSKGTVVKNDEGNVFNNIIIIPKPLVQTQIPVLPEGLSMIKGFKLGSVEDEPLSFSKAFTLKIPINKKVVKSQNIKVITYDKTTQKYKLAGDGGIFDDKLITVETDHMSYFVVVDTGGKNLDFLLETADKTVLETSEEISDTLISIIERKVPTFVSEPAMEFKDIKGHWAETYISDMRRRGVVQGKKEGQYEPDSGLSRAELMKIVINAFGIPLDEVNVKPFPDVSLQKWYTPFISTAKKYGIINGYPNGFFKPNNPISRVEALKVIINTAGQKMESEGLNNPFFDIPENAWYTSYVKFANRRGLLDPVRKGHFLPAKTITRGEISKVIVKLWRIMQD